MASGEKIAAGSSLHEVFHRHSREAQQHLATINTFLEAHDLAGKRIVPFFTSGGSGAGKTLDNLKSSAPKATFETPKNLTHADESAIRTWVQRRLKPSTSVLTVFLPSRLT